MNPRFRPGSEPRISKEGGIARGPRVRTQPVYPSPPDLDFDIKTRIAETRRGEGLQQLRRGCSLSVRVVFQMNDANQWKQLGYGGGASIAVTFTPGRR